LISAEALLFSSLFSFIHFALSVDSSNMPLEFITPEGLRLDGRRAGELRKIHCKLGVIDKADGSAYVEQGNTKALVAVYGPREVVFRSRAEHDRAIVNAEFGVASFSSQQRKKSTRMDKFRRHCFWFCSRI
jgi:ribonuclease PH